VKANQGKKETTRLLDGGFRPAYKQQVRQLAGLRGLMAKPSGEIIEKPIFGDFPRRSVGIGISSQRTGARKVCRHGAKTADSVT